MARIGWVTDIHLDWLEPQRRLRFYKTLQAAALDVLLIGGDIGHADSLPCFLTEVEDAIDAPIYFVLGNHDFYGSSIASVKERVCRHAAASRRLRWMPAEGVVKLSETTALVGHDSWADGRCGDFFRSDLLLNDYLLIEELSIAAEMRRFDSYDKQKLFQKLNALGDEAAEYIRRVLGEALGAFPSAFVLTHAPPFRESCWHQGKISDQNSLPHFACRVFGEALLEVLDQHPGCRVTVLCGHTHSAGFAQIRPNLSVWTGRAEYGRPILQKTFDV